MSFWTNNPYLFREAGRKPEKLFSYSIIFLDFTVSRTASLKRLMDSKCTCFTRQLPGGATILCHFWNRHVLRQSRGLRLQVLCLDMSSCMGSRMTHNCGRDGKKPHGQLKQIYSTFYERTVSCPLLHQGEAKQHP